MGKVKSPCCYLWLGNMPTSAWGVDMLERWLENRLLPMAPIRHASCSLTTLGMLRESSGKREKQERRRNKHPNPTCISSSQFSRDNRIPKVYPAFTYQEPKTANWNIPLDFTATVQKDIHINPCRMRSLTNMGQEFLQIKWLSGKYVWGIQLLLELNSCD